MEEKKKRIYEWKTEAFLVYGKELGENEAPFYHRLREEGFTCGGRNGTFGCPWAYVNITRKQFAYGMPGVSVVQPIGDHAITIDEFRTIYAIYKKYEGKDLFVFTGNALTQIADLSLSPALHSRTVQQNGVLVSKTVHSEPDTE